MKEWKCMIVASLDMQGVPVTTSMNASINVSINDASLMQEGAR